MYQAEETRYDQMEYIHCGKSGLKLPRLALGLWHNFGSSDSLENQKALLCGAFDRGITHLDIANNYGPIAGAAEENFGRILKSNLSAYRDELIISTKAGYGMWKGPYGDWGSRKYLMASIDQSLKRLGLDYVDIFYHHRPDPETPLEETMGALSDMVHQGKALYVGISNYNAEQTKRAVHLVLGERRGWSPERVLDSLKRFYRVLLMEGIFICMLECCFVIGLFETGSHVAQARLELDM